MSESLTVQSRFRRDNGLFLLAAGVSLALFLALAMLVSGANGPVGLDRVAHWLSENSWVGRALGADKNDVQSWRFARATAPLGSAVWVATSAAVLFVLALALRDRLGAAVALAAPAMTFVLIEYVAKPLINQPTPTIGRGFPSGHVAGVTAVVLVALVMVARRWGPVLAALGVPVAAVLIAVVSFAVLRLNLHYPTDVAGGVLLATAVVLGLTGLLDAPVVTRHLPPP